MTIKFMIGFDAVLFITTIILGIMLFPAGKPYNSAIFTVHKLAALGTVVFTFILCHNFFKNASVSDLSGFYILIIAIAGFATVILFITGALMSSGNAAYHILRISHIVPSILLTACKIAIMIYLTGKLR